MILAIRCVFGNNEIPRRRHRVHSPLATKELLQHHLGMRSSPRPIQFHLGCLLLLFCAIVATGCSTPRAEVRSLSYDIRGHKLVNKSAADGERAMIILSDEHPSPLAHLHFWSESSYDPKEKHWNRQADEARCPACHPQYDLHFSTHSLEPIMAHLQQKTIRLTCRDDDWTIESPGSGLAPVHQTK